MSIDLLIEKGQVSYMNHENGSGVCSISDAHVCPLGQKTVLPVGSSWVSQESQINTERSPSKKKKKLRPNHVLSIVKSPELIKLKPRCFKACSSTSISR